MDEESRDGNPPSKWDFVEYITHILSSDVEVHFAPSMRHQPPIVSLEEILAAKDLCPNNMGGCKILEINASTVLKVGPTIQMGEAEALCLVRKRTSVPVPEVFNAYTIAEFGFILMSKIPGVSLERCWKDLTRDVRVSIVQQLRGFIQEWRQIEGPLFGSIDGGPCEDVLFQHSWDAEPRRYGPFSTRKEFNQGVVEALRYSRPNGKLTTRDVPLAERILVSSSQDEKKVLTHGDLHQSNIIVDGDVVTGVIDWALLATVHRQGNTSAYDGKHWIQTGGILYPLYSRTTSMIFGLRSINPWWTILGFES